MPTQSLSTVGQIAAAISELQLKLIDATVTIRHEEREGIAVNANNPANWKIDGGLIRQTQAEASSGINVFTGGGVFVGGNVRVNRFDSITVGRGGVVIGGNNTGNISVGEDRTTINAGGRNVEIIGEEVWVDGKKVTSASSSESSGAPSGDASKPNTTKKEPDRLEIVVPLSYRGGLDLNNPGSGNVEVDSWSSGNFALKLSGSGDFKAGAMGDLGEVELRSSGSGDIEIDSLKSRNFTGALSGSGELEIAKLNTGDFTLRQSGSGDTTISSGSALTGSVNNSGSGDTSMRGRFSPITKRNSGSGDIKIRVSE